MSSENRQRITIEMDPDLPLHVIHGVFGGVNQTGEIEVNFYTQCEDLPAPAELLVTEDGRLLQEHSLDDHPETRRFTRTIHTRAVVTPENARDLAMWLMAQIDRAQERAPAPAGSLAFDEPQSNSRQ